MYIFTLYRNLYVGRYLLWILAGLAVCYALGFTVPIFYFLANILSVVLFLCVIVDGIILFANMQGIHADRHVPKKLSNGDPNPIQLHITNRYSLAVHVHILEEAPIQFQWRDNRFAMSLHAGQNKKINYTLRPTKRGEYNFGHINILVETPLRLLKRKYELGEAQNVPVYPSFIQMRRYELLAFSNRLMDFGYKKIRRLGHSMEFEQIKSYVIGDDYRNINWKASGKYNRLMVNQYQDERAQDVYCIIDKGRLMRMPFEGLSLLDYSINATLALANIILKKHDKVGLITFSNKMSSVIKADDKATQLYKIQEVLYNQKTYYKDANFELLNSYVKRRVTKRSLVLLFTNFESRQGANRQLRYMEAIAQKHFLVVIFFENTELTEFAATPAQDTRQLYQKTIAQKLEYDKQLIVHDLQQRGIQVILTKPKNLTINTINKYLEIKSRQLL